MGLSFHYSGNIKDRILLPELIHEISEISEVNAWEYYVLEEKFPISSQNHDADELYGICFTPPECETVFFTFLANGRLTDPHLFECFGQSTNPKEREFQHLLTVKTQFAGIECHKTLVKLLKYLDKKYFSDFTVTDEGAYWETGDEKLLQQIFHRYNALMDTVESALQNLPRKKDESFEEFYLRMKSALKDITGNSK